MTPPDLPRSLGNSIQMIDQNIGVEKFAHGCEFAHRSHSRRSFS
jgi:hypothetical protein